MPTNDDWMLPCPCVQCIAQNVKHPLTEEIEAVIQLVAIVFDKGYLLDKTQMIGVKETLDEIYVTVIDEITETL